MPHHGGAGRSGRVPVPGRDEAHYPAGRIPAAVREASIPPLYDRAFVDALLQSSPLAVLVLDPQGCIAYANSRLEELSGWPVEEARGQDWFETFVPERDRNAARAGFAAVLRDTQPADTLEAIVTRSGEERLVEWRRQAIRDDGGTVTALLATGIDVTERRSVETALRESEARLNEAQQLAQVGSWDLDLTTGLLAWSDEIYRIFEIDKSEFGASYEAFLNLVHPDDRDAVDDAYTSSLENRERYEIVHRLLLPDGRVKHVRERCKSDFDETGKPLRSVGTVQDITERRRAELLVQESEQRLRGILDSMFAFVGVFSLEGAVVEINRALLDALNLQRENAIGAIFWESPWVSHSSAVQEQIRTLIGRAAQGETIREDVAARVGDGVLATIDATFGPLYDSEGHVAQIVASGVDVTDRRQAEELVRENERRLRHTLDSMAAFIAYLSPDGTVIDVNRRPLDATGRRRQDLLGKPWWESASFAGSPALQEPVREALRRAAQGEALRVELLADLGGDTLRTFDTSIAPLLDGEGRVTEIVAAGFDITERILAEQRVRESEQRVRDIFNGMSSFVVLLTAGGIVLEINQSPLEVTGSRREDLVGRFLWESSALAYSDAAQEREREDILRAAQGEIVRDEFELEVADGSFITIDTIFTPLFDDEGRVTHIVGAANDVTDLKRATAALEEINADLDRRVQERTAELEAANRELETFTYSVSHDLKAPLRSIDGYSRLLLEDYAERLDDEGRHLLDTVRHATSQMNQLIDDLLAYSRLERRELAVTQLEPRALIESLLAEWDDEMRARGIAVEVQAAGGPVTADRDGLTMALRNLIENALKFLGDSPAPAVEISCSATDEAWLFAVRDNGIGFDMRYHDRIFGIFQRLHRAEDYPGTGVGLAIVRRAVERMDGRAWAESEPGKGATFFVELPR